jgi:hypothetical protein
MRPLPLSSILTAVLLVGVLGCVDQISREESMVRKSIAAMNFLAEAYEKGLSQNEINRREISLREISEEGNAVASTDQAAKVREIYKSEIQAAAQRLAKAGKYKVIQDQNSLNSTNGTARQLTGAAPGTQKPPLNLGQLELARNPDAPQFNQVVILEQPPSYYKGPAPLKFAKVRHRFRRDEMRDVAHDFNEWVNHFIYTKDNNAEEIWKSLMNWGIPTGARATNRDSRRTVAEGRLLGLAKENNMLTLKIEEFHFDALSNVTYQCQSSFDIYSGFKIAESEAKGRKEKEFFFLWPVTH